MSWVLRAKAQPDTHHYKFDFSQCVSLPHYSRQVGPLYFLTLRKVQLFGFRISGGQQLNFLVDETDTIGEDGKLSHGPDSVISMIHWALESRPPSTSFAIHADNCPGTLNAFMYNTNRNELKKSPKQINYIQLKTLYIRCKDEILYY